MQLGEISIRPNLIFLAENREGIKATLAVSNICMTNNYINLL